MNDKLAFIWNRKWLWIIILFAVSIAFSYLQPVRLGEGGEVTFFSMLAIYLIGYFFGGWTGVAAAFAYGILRYLIDYQFTLNVAELADYVLGYGLLGFGGFFLNRDIRYGYIFAALLRYVESVINCIMFYYIADISFSANVWDGIIYTAGYVGVEFLITIAFLCIPQVREAIDYWKYIATHPYERNLDSF